MASRNGERGITFLEMLATTAILVILAGAVLPLARVAKKRQKEIELRHSLRVIRTAIDRFHDDSKNGRVAGTCVKLGAENYPEELELLVKGCAAVGKIGTKVKYLRRIPVDPMTGTNEWGMRCYQDDPDSTSFCGENVWDVYSKSEGKGLDGTPYKDW